MGCRAPYRASLEAYEAFSRRKPRAVPGIAYGVVKQTRVFPVWGGGDRQIPVAAKPPIRAVIDRFPEPMNTIPDAFSGHTPVATPGRLVGSA